MELVLKKLTSQKLVKSHTATRNSQVKGMEIVSVWGVLNNN